MSFSGHRRWRNSQVVTDLHNGLLVPSQDVKALVLACRKLLDDRVFAERMGRQAWLDCKTLCAPSLIAKQTVAGYQLAIDRFQINSTSRRKFDIN